MAKFYEENMIDKEIKWLKKTGWYPTHLLDYSSIQGIIFLRYNLIEPELNTKIDIIQDNILQLNNKIELLQNPGISAEAHNKVMDKLYFDLGMELAIDEKDKTLVSIASVLQEIIDKYGNLYNITKDQ